MQPCLDAPVALTSSFAHRKPKRELLDTAAYASHDWAMRNILRILVPERFSFSRIDRNWEWKS
jgi:hypothetical protein